MVEDLEHTPGGTLHSGPTRPGPLATGREMSCPSAGKHVSAYREIGMSASTLHGPDGSPTNRNDSETLFNLIETVFADGDVTPRPSHDGSTSPDTPPLPPQF